MPELAIVILPPLRLAYKPLLFNAVSMVPSVVALLNVPSEELDSPLVPKVVTVKRSPVEVYPISFNFVTQSAFLLNVPES